MYIFSYNMYMKNTPFPRSHLNYFLIDKDYLHFARRCFRFPADLFGTCNTVIVGFNLISQRKID